MSNRAANEGLCDKLLRSWREEQLEGVDDSAGEVHSFHCMVHVLLGMQSHSLPHFHDLHRENRLNEIYLGREALSEFQNFRYEFAPIRCVRLAYVICLVPCAMKRLEFVTNGWPIYVPVTRNVCFRLTGTTALMQCLNVQQQYSTIFMTLDLFLI